MAGGTTYQDSVVLSRSITPTTPVGKGTVFLSDGTGGLTIDHLYFRAPNNVDVSGDADIPASANFVSIDTSEEQALLYLPELADVPDGHPISFRIREGDQDAILTPGTLDDGVNGPPGSVLLLDAVNLPSCILMADKANNAWWLVASTPPVTA